MELAELIIYLDELKRNENNNSGSGSGSERDRGFQEAIHLIEEKIKRMVKKQMISFVEKEYGRESARSMKIID
jgi:hypothetical protein